MFVNHLHKIPMCGADHTHIGKKRCSAAQTLELFFLDDTEKLWLQLKWKIPDLVQEQGTPTSPFKPSNVARNRASIGAPLVTEELAFKQACGNCSAIHFHKWTLRSVAALVNSFCDDFLASSCFAIDQHRGVGGSHNFHHVEYVP